MSKSRWRRISVRSELVKEIEKLVKLGKYGSIAEFIHEAIRLRLEQVRPMFLEQALKC